MKKIILIFVFMFALPLVVFGQDSEVSNLAELSASPEDTDLLYIIDGGTSKKIQYNNLVEWKDEGDYLAPRDIEKDVRLNGNLSVNKELTVEGRLFLGDVPHAYGGFLTEDTVIVISNANEWTWMTNGSNDLWIGAEADHMTMSGDILTVTASGDYDGILVVSLSSLPNKDYEIRLYNITDDVGDYEMDATTTGAGNYMPVSLPLYFEADAGDQFRLEIRNTSDSTNVTLRTAIFKLKYLHE